MKMKRGINVFRVMVFLNLLLLGCGAMLAKMDTDRRQQYVGAHPELDQRTREAILNGKIFIGMTRVQVIASWAMPYDTNRTVGSWGVHEQWIYGDYTRYGIKNARYLYFENGILTSWQD